MPVIYNRNFATGNQRYLSLGANDYSRTMNIGISWNRLRIGMLYALSTVSETTWPLRGGILCLGVCSGSQSSVSALSPRHAFGFGVGTPVMTAPASWAYNAGTGGNSYYFSGGWSFFRVLSGVYTTAAVGSLTVYAPSNTTLGGASARRGILIVDINKSAPISGNITQGATSGVIQHMALDITTPDLYSALEQYATPALIQGTSLSAVSLGNSLAFNEAVNGLLDTVFIYWNNYTVPLQLYELALYRVG